MTDAPTVADIEREYVQRDRRMLAHGMALEWAARERGFCPVATRNGLVPGRRPGCAHCGSFNLLARIGA